MKLTTRLFLFLLSIIFTYTVQAQDVLYSKYDKFDYHTGEFSVVGKAGNKLYVYRGSAEGYYIDAYDDKMERLATVILDFMPKRTFGTKFITYKDKLIVLYQESKGSDVIQYAALLDVDGRLKKGPVEVDRVSAGFLGGRSGLYSYAVSPDKEQIVVYGVGTKRTVLDARMIWIDTELTKQSLSEGRFEGDNNVAFGSAIVDNNGKLFLPVYTPFGGRDYADRVWLLSTLPGGTAFKSAELPLGDMYASGTYMELAKETDKIYVGGFYSDRKNGHFEGIIYTYYDIAGETFLNYKTIPFSERMRNSTGERNKKRAFNDYRVRQLIVRNDGGFVMVAEDYYVTIRNNYNQGFGYYSWYYPTMTASVREYTFGNILAISCNGDGKPEWTKFVRKYQYAQEDGYLFASYALVNTGGSLGFLFNNFNMNRSRIQVSSLNSSGELNTTILHSVGENPPDWLPKSGKQVSANEFVAPCLKRNAICFAKVVF